MPAELPDVALEHIALSYDTGSGVLDIQAITDWTFAPEVPLLGGSTSKAILQITVARDPQQGTRSATFFVDWTLHTTYGAGAALTLDAQSTLSADAQSVGVDLEIVGEPAHFSDLTTQLPIPEVIPHRVEGVLDELFALQSLSLNYSRPANAIDVAWSRPLGDGSLLIEVNRTGHQMVEQSVADGAVATTGGTITPDGSLSISWLANRDDSTLGISDIATLLDGSEVVAEIEGLPVMGEAIHDLLTFRRLGFNYDVGRDSDVVTLTALSTFAGGTDAFLAVRRTGEQRGIVAGLALTHSDSTSAGGDVQPGWGLLPADQSGTVAAFISAVETVIDRVELTHLLLSTFSSTTVQPPAFQADVLTLSDQTTEGAATHPFGTGLLTLTRGASIGARLRFGKDDVVRKIVDVDEIDAVLTLGDVGLQVAIPGELSLDAGGGNTLVLKSPSLRIRESLADAEAGPEFDVSGELALHVFGQRLDVSGWVALTAESVTGHIELTELPFAGNIVPMLPGVQLVVEPPWKSRRLLI